MRPKVISLQKEVSDLPRLLPAVAQPQRPKTPPLNRTNAFAALNYARARQAWIEGQLLVDEVVNVSQFWGMFGSQLHLCECRE